MKLWLLIVGCWLLFSGVLFASLVLAMGMPVLISLWASLGLMAVLFWLWSRDIPAKDLRMRESTWNTPDDDVTKDERKDA